MPVTKDKIRLEIGYVDCAIGNRMRVTVEVDAQGNGGILVHVHSPRSRRDGELMVLGAKELRDLADVFEAASSTVERLVANGQMKDLNAKLTA